MVSLSYLLVVFENGQEICRTEPKCAGTRSARLWFVWLLTSQERRDQSPLEPPLRQGLFEAPLGRGPLQPLNRGARPIVSAQLG